MDNKNIAVLEGGNLPLTVERQDPEALSATLILKHTESGAIIEVTGNYVDGVADVSLDGDNTSVVGVYEYQVNENFESGSPDKYPNPNNCDGDFEFPTITIYNSLDEVDES